MAWSTCYVEKSKTSILLIIIIIRRIVGTLLIIDDPFGCQCSCGQLQWACHWHACPIMQTNGHYEDKQANFNDDDNRTNGLSSHR